MLGTKEYSGQFCIFFEQFAASKRYNAGAGFALRLAVRPFGSRFTGRENDCFRHCVARRFVLRRAHALVPRLGKAAPFDRISRQKAGALAQFSRIGDDLPTLRKTIVFRRRSPPAVLTNVRLEANAAGQKEVSGNPRRKRLDFRRWR
jgi:hypothetical protein